MGMLRSYWIDALRSWARGLDPAYELFIKGKRTLDIGCGAGALLRKAPDLIEGIDVNATLVERLVQEGLKVQRASATSLPYPDATFDVVNCAHVIEHLVPQDAQLMLREAQRVLRPGGLLLLNSPMPGTVWNTFGHVKPYPPMAVRKLFRQTSLEAFDSVPAFTIRRVVYLGGWSWNKLTFLLSTLIANLTPWCRSTYLMEIEKK